MWHLLTVCFEGNVISRLSNGQHIYADQYAIKKRGLYHAEPSSERFGNAILSCRAFKSSIASAIFVWSEIKPNRHAILTRCNSGSECEQSGNGQSGTQATIVSQIATEYADIHL